MSLARDLIELIENLESNNYDIDREQTTTARIAIQKNIERSPKDDQEKKSNSAEDEVKECNKKKSVKNSRKK